MVAADDPRSRRWGWRTLDSAELRLLQQPLKEAYREDADSALVTLTAASTLGDDVSCSVQTGQAMVRAGLHPATGGDGTLICSGDLLLQALAACAGVTLSAVSTALGVRLNTGRIDVEGDLDHRRQPRRPRHSGR